MDLNQLYFDHQLLLMRRPAAGHARRGGAAARLVARRIGRFQRTLGAAGATGWEALAISPCPLTA